MIKTLFQALIILALILQGVESGAQPNRNKKKETEKEPTKQPLELSPKVYAKVAPSIVKIECDGGNKIGTGTIVGLTQNGLAVILTACHVVAVDFEKTPADKSLRFYNDVIVKLATDTTKALASAVLRFYDRSKDLILIATRKSVPEKNLVINYNRSKHAGPGTVVAAMGFPDSDTLSQAVGNVKRVEGGFLISDAKIAPGSSGGPLIDKFGRMVGLSRSTFEEEGYAVPADTVIAVIDNWLLKIQQTLPLMTVWQYQRFGNFGQRMIKDWRFVATEVSIAGVAGYFIFRPPIPPDLPGPPKPPK